MIEKGLVAQKNMNLLQMIFCTKIKP